jgi:mRNA-degrading endonuclease RelE of RelBE toxin-antitoxin system
MVDIVQKFFKKLSERQQDVVSKIFDDIYSDCIDQYDVKKLSGHDDIFRIRKGNIRIIFIKSKEITKILRIGNRDDSTYAGF